MRVLLMHRDRDFDLEAEPPPGGEDLVQDLELDTLWSTMAAGDEFLFEVAKQAVLSSLGDPDAIVYRQRVLVDCFEQPAVVQEMYELAIEGIRAEREVGWFWSHDSPERILHRSVEVLKLHLDVLKRLRRLAEEHAGTFGSEGFTRFFAMLGGELDDDYLQAVEDHLRELEFKRGLVISAELGKGNKGRRSTVRKPRERSWTERLSLANRAAAYSFTIPERDENGFKALEDLRGRGLNSVADAAAKSADHIKSFFSLLRAELGFYLGCLNLRERLDAKGEPSCLPLPLPAGEPALDTQGLYDVSLTLHLDRRAVGNDVGADGKSLVMITGANEGGKSTFLRSVGLAHLMMQCGMFVGAASFRASVCNGVFTHYKREEDVTMESGKLDEELGRMSRIAGVIAPGCVLLCNESFASTNEKEGSEIARQVVRALVEGGVRVFFVTHLFDLAHSFHAQGLETALFLRAERQPDGTRTFRVVEGEPLPTSFGEDSYRRVFGSTAEAPRAAGAAVTPQAADRI